MLDNRTPMCYNKENEEKEETKMKLCICDVSKQPLFGKKKIIKDMPIFYHIDETDSPFNLERLKHWGYKINNVRMIIEIPDRLVITAYQKAGKNPTEEIMKIVEYYEQKMLDKL